MGNNQKAKIRFLYCLTFLTPFLIFCWMLPFIANLTLGTDYIDYHIHHHLEMMFSIQGNSFPLYAPECFYGNSASGYTLAQLYHPIAWLASILPGYWNGFSLEWMTLLKLLSLALCQAFLLSYILKFRVSKIHAFLLSFIAVYNLRMLLLFWHGSALEAYTGMIFLCVAVGFYFLEPHRKILVPLIIFSSYWLLTSGHCPMVYYGIIGAILFTLLIPFFSFLFFPDLIKNHQSVMFFWGKAAFFFIVSLALSAAYLFPFLFDFMQNNAGRVSQSYPWSIHYTDTLAGFINNFFFPLRSGNSMFGGSPLFLVAVMIPVSRFFRYKVPKIIWIMLLLILIISLYMQGGRTPVHYLVWKFVPLVSSIRCPDRIAIILPLLFTLLLIWIIKGQPGKTNLPDVPVENGNSPVGILAFCALLITLGYYCLPLPWFTNNNLACPCLLRSIPELVEPTVIVLSLFILIALSMRNKFKKKLIIDILILILTVFESVIIIYYGAPAITSKTPTLTLNEIKAEKENAINLQNVLYLNEGAGSKTVVTQLKNYFIEPGLAKVYRKYKFTENIDQTYQYLNSYREQDEVVVEKHPERDIMQNNAKDCMNIPDMVRLIYSSYNRLDFIAQACQSAFFVCSYPYSSHWRAWLNGKRVPTYRANGASIAIKIPGGTNKIELRYWSNAAFWGMIISCLAIAILGFFYGFVVLPKFLGYFVIIGTLVISAGIFSLWLHSLYTGKDLHTQYEWSTPVIDSKLNLAFGKPTSQSSYRSGYPYRYNSRHAVDGDISAASISLTAVQKNPWWRIDLKKQELVESIIIYDRNLLDLNCKRKPYILFVSQDDKEWKSTIIETTQHNEGLHILFEKPETMRYITIMKPGICRLGLNEVNVFPPQREGLTHLTNQSD